MGFGGVAMLGIGIFVAVLAANGRWPAVWSAITGGASGTIPPIQQTTVSSPPSSGADAPGGGQAGGW